MEDFVRGMGQRSSDAAVKAAIMEQKRRSVYQAWSKEETCIAR